MSRAHKTIRFVVLTSAAFSVAVLAFVFTEGARLIHAGAKDKDKDITKSFSFRMPDCPLQQTTVPFSTTEFKLPRKSPLDDAFSVAGTVQIADQSGGIILKISTAVNADNTGVRFTRTVNTLAHITGSVTFNHGCAATDPYGSNDCTWLWRDSVLMQYHGALQEDITAGKLVVDLNVNNTIPVAFSCPVCGASCAFAVPKQVEEGKWDEIWRLMIRVIRFPIDLTEQPSPK